MWSWELYYDKDLTLCVWSLTVQYSVQSCLSATILDRLLRWNGIPMRAQCWRFQQQTIGWPSGTLPSNETTLRLLTTTTMCRHSCSLFIRDRRRSRSFIGTDSCPVSSLARPMTLSIYFVQSARKLFSTANMSVLLHVLCRLTNCPGIAVVCPASRSEAIQYN